ncbi:hypothetical protein ScPMuIL_004585 [Solemya velum]
MTIFKQGKPKQPDKEVGKVLFAVNNIHTTCARKKQRRWRQTTIALCFGLLIIVFLACAGLLVTETVKIDVSWIGNFFNNNNGTCNLGKTVGIKVQPQCDIATKEKRFDCWPEFNDATQDKCQARGCCWGQGSTRSDGMPGDPPYCFFPSNYPGYTTGAVLQTAFGLSAKLSRSTKSPWPADIMQLQVDIYYETDNRVHFKIYDPNDKRYEVPVETPPFTTKAANPTYDVNFQAGDFKLIITRKGSGQVLFDTTDVVPLIFADQYIQLGTKFSSPYVYGLGEHRGSFSHDIKWTKITFWARDQPPSPGVNLYGDHPFFMNMEPDGNAHGVFLLNSNTMEADLQAYPAITYRTIGGILDFYVFSGPTPDTVIEQYTDVIGKPFMPPYWALGFHLCRWGWGGANGMKKVIERNRNAKMPIDTMWNDIDYMSQHLDFTLDTDKFGELPAIVDDLHANDQHYIMILDPGISNVQTPGSYAPYDEGLAEDIFIKKADGSGPIIGKVWPGETAFPDFFNPQTTTYWYNQCNGFYQKVKFDGIWIDMNEPSNFVDGSIDGCTSNKYDNPPYVPPVLGGGSLQSKTLCCSSLQNTTVHYNLHNLYGHGEAIASNNALNKIHGKRTIVISRSTFPSTGRYSGHWLGDNNAQWADLDYSMSGMLNINMFGISLVGPDICGFNGNTTSELCTRWMQLGAFYPFMRNHNTLGDMDQDPASFDTTTQDRIRAALQIRYLILPYLYTLFYQSSSTGTPIIRALFYQYPTLTDVYGIDDQFMMGQGLLITPIITQGAVSRTGYLPQDTWYDLYNQTQTRGSGSITFNIPLDKIGIHIRGGSIIPTMTPAMTTGKQRKTGTFQLTVALNSTGGAGGQLYWDDGDQLDVIKNGHFNLIEFVANQQTIVSTIAKSGYTPSTPMILEAVMIMGVPSPPSSVTINGQSCNFNYDTASKSLDIIQLTANLMKPLQIIWK